MIAVIPRPTAVNPWANYKCVKNPRIVLVNRVERAERALQIFCVEPSAHGKHCAVDILHVWRKIARLPVIVVNIVVHLVVKQRTLAFKIF